MKYQFELENRYRSAFGAAGNLASAYGEGGANIALFKAGIAYNELQHQSRRNRESGFDNIPVYQPDSFNFAEIELTSSGETVRFGFQASSDSENDYFAPSPLLSFDQSKKTIITIIDDGNENEIIENFGIKSWVITLRGIVVDMENHLYPGDKIQTLNRIFKANEVLSVTSPIFNDLGIYSVWTESLRIDPIEGFKDTIKYTLKLHSIKPADFGLIIEE